MVETDRSSFLLDPDLQLFQQFPNGCLGSGVSFLADEQDSIGFFQQLVQLVERGRLSVKKDLSAPDREHRQSRL